MQYVGMIMPVLPGKTDEAKRFGHEVVHNRLQDHDRTHRASTMVRDCIWLQHTPMGDVLIDYVEAEDLMSGFQQFVTSRDPYMVWVKDELRGFTGIDFNNPPPGMPEMIFDWNIGDGKQSVAFALPVLPGKTDRGRAFAQEVRGPRRPEHDESRRSKGLTKELGWINATPMGDILVIYLEGDDPVKANQLFAASQTPYDLWFKQQAGEVSGIDFGQPLPPMPEVIFDWRAST